MADQLQLRGGTTAENATFTGAQREVTIDTDKDVIVVHDGVTAGGFPMASSQSITDSTIYFDDNTGGGSVANAYVLSPKSNSRTPTTYDDGITVGFVTSNANTGASTVNIGALGVRSIKVAGGADPAAGTIDGRVELVFDETNNWFELQVTDSIDQSKLLPSGLMGSFAAATPPTGWLAADGSEVSRTTYADLFTVIGVVWGAGNGSTTFNLPDARGVVLRGVDNGRGLDPGRAFANYQADEFAEHDHSYTRFTLDTFGNSGGGANVARTSSTTNTGDAGGTETRMKNISVLNCIKF